MYSECKNRNVRYTSQITYIFCAPAVWVIRRFARNEVQASVKHSQIPCTDSADTSQSICRIAEKDLQIQSMSQRLMPFSSRLNGGAIFIEASWDLLQLFLPATTLGAWVYKKYSDIPQTEHVSSADGAQMFHRQNADNLHLAAWTFMGVCNRISHNSSHFHKLLVTFTVGTLSATLHFTSYVQKSDEF